MKKTILMSLLAALLLVCTACNPNGGNGDITTAPEEKPEVTLPLSDLGQYSIVYPQGDTGELRRGALALKKHINEVFGVTVSMKEDFYVSWEPDKFTTDYEILIGEINRDEVTEAEAGIGYFDYGWRLAGKKIVIFGGTYEMTLRALEEFTAALSASDTVFYSSKSDKFVKSDTVYPYAGATLCGRPFSDYTVVYSADSGSAAQATAENIRAGIGTATGTRLPVCPSEDAGELDAVILIGGEQSSADSFGEGKYSVSVRDGKITVSVSGDDCMAEKKAAEVLLNDLFPAAGTPAVLGDGFVKQAVSAADYVTEVSKMSGYAVKSIRIGTRDISEYSIVYGASSAEAKEAAEALSAYLKKACGATLSVIPDTSVAAHEIVIGATTRDTSAVTSRREKLVNDGVMYYASGDRLFIGGNTRVGTYYAVYRFLEEKIGCRFYSDNSERVLPSDGIIIPSDLDYSYSPPLFYRYTDWGLGTDMRRKLCLNGYDGVENSIVWGQHTMTSLAGCAASAQPCLTSEETYQTVLKNVRALIAANPGCRVISVTQNDNKNYCICEKCSALAAKENQSGIMISFANRLAKEINTEYPDVYILTFAYQYTRTPPVTVVPDDHVIVWLCSIECCFSDALSDSSCEKNSAFVSDIEEWSKIAKNLYIWDYSTNYRYYNMPFADFDTLFMNASFYLSNNAIGIYEEGGYAQIENGEFSRLRAYLTAHLLWDPDMTREEYYALMDDFLEGYYGAGWKYIRHFIDLTTQMASGKHMTIYMNPASYLPKQGNVDNAYLLECFTRAEAAAVDNDTKNHCRYSSLQARLLIGNYDPEGDDLLTLMKEAGIAYCSESAGNTPVAGMTKNSQIVNLK